MRKAHIEHYTEKDIPVLERELTDINLRADLLEADVMRKRAELRILEIEFQRVENEGQELGDMIDGIIANMTEDC